MLFSSLLFLFVYLPIVIGIYYLIPLKWRNPFLLIANLNFYGFGEPIYIIIMIVSIFIDYTHGILVERNRLNNKKAKRYVIQSIILNLGLLFFFKYYDFILLSLQSITPFFDTLKPMGLSLPIGISFYTFQTMSYTIDIYRQDANVQKSRINFGVYVTLFPQLIAGPIVKYKDLESQLTSRTHTLDQFSQGIYLFVGGLCKKVLLANNIGLLWEMYKNTPSPELTTLGAWMGILAFAFQIYFDFSGYSDMARGLGKMLGFDFLENFNYPYISKSATEFWRRWHISLGSWFRDYVYIPLGGNRKGITRTLRNIMLVWLATGLWHGASWNFLLWGFYYACILTLEKLFLLKYLKKLPKLCAYLYSTLILLCGWAIFAIEDGLLHLTNYLSSMFGHPSYNLYITDDLYYLYNFALIFIICGICSTPIYRKCIEKLPVKLQYVFRYLGMITGLVISTAYLVDASYNPFLYFRF